MKRSEIKKALTNGQFCLFYQPKYSISHSMIEGSEALVRWKLPDGTILTPGMFLDEVEQMGLLKELTQNLMPLLFNDMAILQDTKYAPVSFNATAHDFEDDEFVDSFLSMLQKSKISPVAFEVEITEKEALCGASRVRQNILRLRDAGLGLAMDDFGTGYSSVDTLSRWPFTVIKIDQGLIGRLFDSEKNGQIVKAAIRLAHDIGIDVVAEGVETDQQFKFLTEAGCSRIQGFLIGRPSSLEGLSLREEFNGCPISLAVGLVHIAIMDHVQWRKQVVSFAIRTALAPADSVLRSSQDYLQMDPTKTTIGRWFQREGSVFLALPEFDMAKCNYDKSHQLAELIIHQIACGAALPEIEKMIISLTQHSVDLIKCMMTLENYALAEINRFRQNQYTDTTTSSQTEIVR